MNRKKLLILICGGITGLLIIGGILGAFLRLINELRYSLEYFLPYWLVNPLLLLLAALLITLLTQVNWSKWKNILKKSSNNENPSKIREDIRLGCKRGFVIDNRYRAIKIAINNLSNNEMLVIAGKGHEKKQIQFNKTISFDDVKISKSIIKKTNINAHR